VLKFALYLKKAAAILFIALIAWQPAIKVYVYFCWKINLEYIAQNQCENKDKPGSECDGQCQLVKELKKADTENTPLIPQQQIKKTELPAFINAKLQKGIEDPGDENRQEFIITDKKPAGKLFARGIFQPPEGEV